MCGKFGSEGPVVFLVCTKEVVQCIVLNAIVFIPDHYTNRRVGIISEIIFTDKDIRILIC